MPNRLAEERSPYLRQHAHNPVEWYPWGDDALSRAAAEDKPILLSIGYSACHWCHVMERESFDDPATAALMNELFVNVKVDREERPDLDQIYQLVVQMMGRSGGWPLTVFLTPERKPFYAGTYFPPVERYGMPSFATVLRAVREAWDHRRDEIVRTADELTSDIVRATTTRSDARDVPSDVATRAAKKLATRFDEAHGGFGSRPKFPSTMSLDVMLRAAHAGDATMGARVRKALDAMRAGGIWDHLGGGFHRYSTDERWLVPHFEKMLYDNALLMRLYADAHRAWGDARDAETVRAIASWVTREMTDAEGAFYATQDADSEGEEGKFFVWRPEELDALLAPEESAVAKLAWGVAEGGNFEHTGATVLHANRALDVVATRLGITVEEARARLEPARAKLFDAREKRPKPFRDEKVIATWNGLMIGALADASGALGDRALLEMARRALATVRARLWDGAALKRVWMEGEARIDAFLEDHADLAGAALDVHEASGDRDALDFAKALVDRAIERFWDEDERSFRFASKDARDLIAHTRDAYDHAVPSGTSSIAHALLRLGAHLGDERYERIAESVLRANVGSALDQPMGFGHLIGAMDRYARGATEVMIVAREDDARADPLLDVARRAWAPNRVLARVDPGAGDVGLASRLGGRRQQNGGPTAYVCRARACGLAITRADELARDLRP
ncbi:thioredoxin domain-containing protein [Sandaracinus amylolyticus]|uniref:Thymidylate kinase n=1 Tax=Sandaracinus amylolyticus TaxID=927083 RepID=A0A0F6W659_9BACT|nr:thioredoxin domain-containing protein [Sandaracinus amylolyticus]AKF08283.1 Thymidylate kinase [Sandaracinus amylolyticus]